jgi:hypothetical protein
LNKKKHLITRQSRLNLKSFEIPTARKDQVRNPFFSRNAITDWNNVEEIVDQQTIAKGLKITVGVYVVERSLIPLYRTTLWTLQRTHTDTFALSATVHSGISAI